MIAALELPNSNERHPTNQAVLDRLDQLAEGEALELFLELLNNETDLSRGADPQRLSRDDFPSTKEFRRASIAARKKQAELEMGEALTSLRAIGLSPVGEFFGPFVVVKGTTDQIRQALKLTGVRRAFLDPTDDLDLSREPKSRIDSPLVSQLRSMRQNLAESPLGMFLDDVENTLASDLPSLLNSFERCTGLAAAVDLHAVTPLRHLVDIFKRHLDRRAAHAEVEMLLAREMAAVGATSCALFVRHPPATDRFVLVCMPGILHEEPLLAFRRLGAAGPWLDDEKSATDFLAIGSVAEADLLRGGKGNDTTNA